MASSSSLRHLRRLSNTAKPSTMSLSKARYKLRSEHDPDKALEIYSSVASDDHSSPTTSRFAQEVTVRRLASSGRFSDIESFIESHKNDPKIKDEPFLSNLIRSYGRAGMFQQALHTFHQMDDLGTPRTVLSFNTLLNACNNSKLFDKVPQLFDEIPMRYNLSLDSVSYGVLIKSYCERGLTNKAVEVVEEMERSGVEVTAVAFTTVMDALYKKGQTEEAEKWWDAMRKKGCGLDVAAYNVRIWYSHEGEPENVKALIEEMIDAGIKPDTISYNYLMICYCKKGMMYEAKKVYDELAKNKCRPNAATFRTLISYLCKDEDFARGYKVFKKSVEARRIPDFNTMRALVEGLVKEKKMKEAKGMLRTIKKTFPSSSLSAWKQVEASLGLAPGSAASDDYKEVAE